MSHKDESEFSGGAGGGEDKRKGIIAGVKLRRKEKEWKEVNISHDMRRSWKNIWETLSVFAILQSHESQVVTGPKTTAVAKSANRNDNNGERDGEWNQ